MQNAHTLLGVSPDASEQEIRHALFTKWHPDKRCGVATAHEDWLKAQAAAQSILTARGSDAKVEQWVMEVADNLSAARNALRSGRISETFGHLQSAAAGIEHQARQTRDAVETGMAALEQGLGQVKGAYQGFKGLLNRFSGRSS